MPPRKSAGAGKIGLTQRKSKLAYIFMTGARHLGKLGPFPPIETGRWAAIFFMTTFQKDGSQVILGW